MTALPDQPWFTIKEAQYWLSLAAGRPIARCTLYRWIERGALQVSGEKFFRRISAASLKTKLSQLSQLSHPSA